MSVAASSERFHTVNIRADLPKIKKQYEAKQPMDLPQANYWIHRVIDYLNGDKWDSRIQPDRFKVQHMIANGPRE